MILYREFLVRWWRAFDPHRRIDAVLTGNFAYYAEREFAAALEELGVPFIVLHKENSWTPVTQEFWGMIYRERRGRFLGRRILVYSPIERDQQIGAGVVEPARIEVVGMPRLDVIHSWRAANIGVRNAPIVLFAHFAADVGMPILPIPQRGISPTPSAEGFGWNSEQFKLTRLCRDAHRAIVELAVACPEITVLIKSKGRQRDLRDLPGLLGVSSLGELPGNLRVVHGGSPFELITQASVVCGFHSTLLLEALAAGRPVVVPWFAEALEPRIQRYVHDLGVAVSRASSKEDLIERLRKLALARTPVPEHLPKPTLQLLHGWLGNEDGRAAERAAAAILRVIESNSRLDMRSAAE